MSNNRLGTLLYTAPTFLRIAYRVPSVIAFVQFGAAVFFLPKFVEGDYKFEGIPAFESHENRKAISIGVISWILFQNAFLFRVGCKLPARVFMNAPMKALIIYPLALPLVPRVVNYADILKTSRSFSPESKIAFILDTKWQKYWFSQNGIYTNRALLRNLLNIKTPECNK